MNVWQDIKNKIEFDIIAGVYYQKDKPSKLPSISELAIKYNCGKSTAQKILDELCLEEVLLRKQGVGYFIKPFAKQHLFDNKLNVYEKKMLELVEDMKRLNISKEVLSEMLDTTIDKVYC